jgi:hypothetical protein
LIEAQGVTITVGAAFTNPREVEVEQQGLYEGGVVPHFPPTGFLLGYLVENEEIVFIFSVGAGDRHKLTGG